MSWTIDHTLPAHAPKRVSGWVVLAVVVPAFVTTHLLAAGWGLQDGFERGRAHQKALADAAPRPVPNCKDWFKQCAREEVEAWRKPGRKPT